jgi:hypothetical protein
MCGPPTRQRLFAILLLKLFALLPAAMGALSALIRYGD